MLQFSHYINTSWSINTTVSNQQSIFKHVNIKRRYSKDGRICSSQVEIERRKLNSHARIRNMAGDIFRVIQIISN